MDKILIFGCSWSHGSHEALSPNDKQYKKGEIEEWWKNDSKGWYHYVDYFKNKNVTVIPTPGHGYWAWYQLLLMMDKTNKLNYDEIWIQESLEPRVTLMNLKAIELRWNRPDNIEIVDDIKRRILLSFGKADNHLWELQCTHSGYGFLENITLSIADLFQKFCIEKNINGYVWAMRRPIMNCTKFTRLTFPINSDCLHTELDDKNLHAISLGHQTEEGNKYIGKLINEEIRKMERSLEK